MFRTPNIGSSARTTSKGKPGTPRAASLNQVLSISPAYSAKDATAISKVDPKIRPSDSGIEHPTKVLPMNEQQHPLIGLRNPLSMLSPKAEFALGPYPVDYVSAECLSVADGGCG
jgi:hypothetical protein